jgi:hypothetical protein
MKILKVNAELSGVISVAAYENLRPGFGMEVELDEGEDPEEIYEIIRKILREQFQREGNVAKVELIEKQYEQLRFYPRNGKKYPSITSVLGWDDDWRISEDHLGQYASRGTIIHKIGYEYFKVVDNKRLAIWIDPMDCKELEEDVIKVIKGSLGLHWKDCSYKAFIKKFKDDIEVYAMEEIVYNDEWEIAGTLDIRGLFKGKKSIMDWKTGSYKMPQLAGYAVSSKEKQEQLVVLPVGQTKNKCGYQNPIVSTDIEKEWKILIKAREKFRKRFGT